jgi:hypothetical protein
MLVEILVFGRQEGRLDAVGNGLDRQIQAPLARIFGHQRAVRRHERAWLRMRVVTGGANTEEISNQSDHQPGTGIQLSFIYAENTLPVGLTRTLPECNHANELNNE